MRFNSGALLLLGFLVMGGLYNYTSALMTGGGYRMLITEMTNLGNSAPKTGGGYSLLGSTGQLGASALSGGRYSVSLGTVNSWRPPQADVSHAHAYPNPCKKSRGCTSVTFTRLTLQASIHIFTISGEKVRTVEKTSNIDSVGWDLRNSAGSLVASGLYLYVVKGEGSSKKGKLIVVR